MALVFRLYNSIALFFLLTFRASLLPRPCLKNGALRVCEWVCVRVMPLRQTIILLEPCTYQTWN